jgi:dihydroflavonol-4-reductase
MKIFITGGTGFIGSQLVKWMAETDHQLVCLARNTSNIQPLQEVGARIVYGDLNDKASLLKGMQGCDWVANLAGNFTLWEPDRKVYQHVNVQGVHHLMESALQAGIKKVVHVSTAAAFGKTSWPISEESQPGVCASEYAQTKRAGEESAWQLHREKGLPLVVIYPSAVIGPHDPKAAGRYIKNLVRRRMPAQILPKENFSFVYVHDVCTAIRQALEKEDNIGEKYIVSGANMTWGEINRLICEIAGVPAPRLILPTPVARLMARLLTALANLTKSTPWLDLSIDQVDLMAQGFVIDGSKAERQLGLTYTPIRTALEDAIANP